MKFHSPDPDEVPKADSSNLPPVHDEDTKERIREHLSDINSVITEEDIRNVKTDESLTSRPGSKTPDEEAKAQADELIEKQRREEADEKGEGSNSPDVDNTTWNVLNK